MKFICPVCGGRLRESFGSALCEARHSFDRAKEGYYNFLLSSSGKNHGDNAEMVLARRAFLNTGAYQPLAEAVLSEILCFMPKREGAAALLDIGCGEGYYTDLFERGLPDGSLVYAFDISRDAVRRAAKRNKNIRLAVASAYKMPIESGAFDIAVNMFSPLAPSEISRSLSDDGIFVMAIPGENHLYSLKAATYDKPYKNEVMDSNIDGFTLLSEKKLSYKIKLSSSEEIKNLFMMTPYAYKTSRADTERLLSHNELSVEAEFIIFVYKKADGK